MPKLRASDRIARIDAVKVLASIVGVKPNTVQKSIAYAIKIGALCPDPCSDLFRSESFVVGELSAWAQARRNWRAHADAIAAIWPKIVSGTGHLVTASPAILGLAGATARVHQPPGTLTECQALLARWAARIDELQRENSALRQELANKNGLIEQWRPVIEKKAAERETKRIKSLGSGRPRIRPKR